MIYIWFNRGFLHIVSISQKLVVMPKNTKSQNSKTTFKQNLYLSYFYLSDPIYFCNFVLADPVPFIEKP